MQQSTHYDFVIAGSGIIGTTIALELKRRNPRARILVLDKEPIPHAHSSGRNSGVIHAGFYYPPASLKARMTAEGNRRLSAYCTDRRLPLNTCGKLVVAKNEEEHKQLDVLLERGRQNGSDITRVDLKQAREIEPNIKTFEHALWSPHTKVADPVAVLKALQQDAVDLGVEFRFSCPVIGRDSEHSVRTKTGVIRFEYFVNSAGLQADLLAHSFGFGLEYKSLPFKGLYLYGNEAAPKFRTNIYPVPDLRYPFLGVHVTLTLDGRSKLGPTAMPAFWREQYDGFSGFSLSEFAQISGRQSLFLYHNGAHFFRMAIEEFRKYSRAFMVKRASELATGLHTRAYSKWGRPGIRSQLVNLKTKKLEMDFLLEGDARSLHILNAVSPGWTCSLPFADFVCDRIENLRERPRGASSRLKESEL